MIPSLRYRFAVVAWASLLMSCKMLMGAPVSSSRLDVEARAEQPAGAAILVNLTFTNTSKEPFGYWLGLGQSYPNARLFPLCITDREGKVHRVNASNTWIHSGSGIMKAVEEGQSLQVPAALPPLPPGTYTIRAKDTPGRPARITLRDDPRLLEKRARDIVEGVRKGEGLAQHVAADFPHPTTTRLLLRDLLSEKDRTAEEAASILVRLQKLPPEADAIIVEALRKRLALVSERKSGGSLFYLICLAGAVGSEEALDAVLCVAHNAPHYSLRAQAVDRLSLFKQKRAHRELCGFLEDESEEVRFEAACNLAQRKDPAAIDVLLALVESQNGWRGDMVLRALSRFPDDPRVEPAVRRRLQNPTDPCYDKANRAFRQLQRNQK